jgi:hydroxyethylthiazole kinase-like uncharacterized protein yjeF
MTTQDRPTRAARGQRLPADDPMLFERDLAGLAACWAEAMDRAPITAAEMTGTDAKAQRLGVSGTRLMEHAGTAVAATARALIAAAAAAPRTAAAAPQASRPEVERQAAPPDVADHRGTGPVLVLCGPGNNGGDGFVAARRLSAHGFRVAVVLVSASSRPGTPDAARNWDRLGAAPLVERIHAPVARDILTLGQGVERAALVIDALLGTGVQGGLREPVRTAVELCNRARAAGVPVLAVDTPTACDLTSGELSDPVVVADVTVTFHRPKTGLLTRRGRMVAGRVLVAPIGIPAEADRA